MGPSTTMCRGGLKFGLDPFTPRDYSRGANPYAPFRELVITPGIPLKANYQVFAIAVMMRARESASGVSITSGGEWEYRKGQPGARSADPYRSKAEPSFPPPVTPT